MTQTINKHIIGLALLTLAGCSSFRKFSESITHTECEVVEDEKGKYVVPGVGKYTLGFYCLLSMEELDSRFNTVDIHIEDYGCDNKADKVHVFSVYSPHLDGTYDRKALVERGYQEKYDVLLRESRKYICPKNKIEEPYEPDGLDIITNRL